MRGCVKVQTCETATIDGWESARGRAPEEPN